METILIDLLLDDSYLYVYQGHELINIFENTSRYYQINEKRLLRYARRRSAIPQLINFIKDKPDIDLPFIREILKPQNEELKSY